MTPTPASILFCGKHRVNYAMFDPVYQILRRDPEVRIRISSGRYRRKRFLGWRPPRDPGLRNERLFAEFDIDPAHMEKSGCQDPRPWGVYVSSNLDGKLQPPDSRVSVQIFHGVSFRNFAVNPKYSRFDKLFFPGRYMFEQYVSRGILTPDDPRAEIMGMPKLDRLVDGTITREGVLESLGLDPARPTVLWCPTGARHNGYELLGTDGIRAIEAAGVNLIIKLHDHPHLAPGVRREEIVAGARAAAGEHTRVTDHSDVAPLLVAADLLVSDASSVAYEYCIRDRPIVFIDVPELLSARAATEGSNMDLDTHGRKVGVIAKSAGELTEAVRAQLDRPEDQSAERRAAAAHIFHEPGTAARRTAARLKELAASPPDR